MTALPTLRFPRLHADWHNDVGVRPEDWAKSRLLAAVPLPHMGPEAQLEVRLHRDGTWWLAPWMPHPEIVPWTATEYTWGDETTGEVRTRLEASVVPPLEEAREVSGKIASWVEEEDLDARAASAALSVVLDLASGGLHDRVARAARVFEQGIDDDDARGWMECIVALRIALEEVSMRHDVPALIDALARADHALDGYAPATLLVRDEVWQRVTGKFPVDEETWWGRREALARRIPEEDVKRKLTAKEAPGEVIPFRPRSPAGALWRAAAAERDVTTLLRDLADTPGSELRTRFGEALEALEATPCPWLRQDIKRTVASLAPSRGNLGWRWDALQEAIEPSPGRVAVLLYLPERHEGVLLELRIAHGEGGLWSRAASLMPVAREAIRCAFAAVAAASDTRQPRFQLEEHTLDLVGPERTLDELCAIDGTSLALPSALAFASAWLGRAPAWDIAATGGLAVRDDGPRVLPVGSSGLQAKNRALLAWTHPATPRLLVARTHATGEQGVVGVDLLEEALELAGTSLRGASSWAPLGDQSARVAELEKLFHELRTQDLSRHRLPGSSPWNVLANRMQLIAGSLHGALPMEDARLRQAEAYVALARAHAGDMEGLGRIPDVGEDPSLPPAVAVVRLLSQLVRHIGAERFEACASLRSALDAKLAELHETERRSLLGVVRGTQGRSFLHDRRLAREERVTKALPLLEESVAHHSCYQPVEAARSRIYLAMALRTSHDWEGAASELERANHDLEAFTRAWSGAYYRSTRTYLLYERARLDVVTGRFAEALDCTREAFEQVDEQSFWPAIGLLRTQAWALRSLGRAEEANASVERMRELARQVPASTQRLIERIVREAEGNVVADGEVY